MNDMELIASLRPEELLPSPAELSFARERLIAALACPPDGRGGQVRASGAPPRGRGSGARRFGAGAWAWRLPLAGSGVAAAAVAVAVALSSGAVAPPRTGGRPAGPGAGGPPSLPVRLTAAQFLTAAAASALREQQAAPPRPDQFVYTETETVTGPGARPQIRRAWISVSGARQGLIEPAPPAPPGSWTPCTLAQQKRTGCISQAAFLSNLPANPRKLLAYLGGDAASPGIPNWIANNIGKKIWGLGGSYLLPAQWAAVYRLMARIPGLHLVRSVRDVAGRPGVGVYWRYEGSKTMLIFNPRTYAFMASKSWPAPGSGVRGPLTSALLKTAVVSTLPAAPNQVSLAEGPRPAPSPEPTASRTPTPVPSRRPTPAPKR